MNNLMATRSRKRGVITFVLISLLLSSCVTILAPKDRTLVHTPVVASIDIRSQCGPHRVTLDGTDVTNLFSPPPSPAKWSLQGTLPMVSPGAHILEASADTTQYWTMIPTCNKSTASAFFSTAATSDSSQDTNYMAQCRAAGVPIPPPIVVSTSNYPTYWEYLGDLGIEPGSRNLVTPGASARIYAYSDPATRGACMAILRYGNFPQIGLICQAADGGKACFWDNETGVQPPTPIMHPGVHPEIAITSLQDPIANGAGGGIRGDDCTICHRGNNAFILFPDDPVWAKALRGPLVTTPGSTFTTRVASSTDTDHAGRPRYIPIGMTNPLPGPPNPQNISGCASGCHERPDTHDNFRNLLGATAGTFPAIPPLLSSPPSTMPPMCGNACYK